MKSFLKILTVSLVVVGSQSAKAGVSKFDSNEFNSIISENLKAEKDLREHLRTQAGVPDMKKEMNPNFAEKGRQIFGTVEAENIAAPTTNYVAAPKQTTSKKGLMDKDLNRVSQELNDSDMAQ